MSADAKLVGIVIVNWNARECLRRSLNALRESVCGDALLVVVVDNASTDGSADMVRASFPECQVIANASNAGYACANNQGIAACASQYVLLLNPDAYVAPDTIEKLTSFMQQDCGLGALGPMLLNADGSLQYSCRAFPTLGAGLFRQTPLGALFPHNRFTADYLMTAWDHTTPREVDWLSGACVMLRRRALDEIGGLDESFYMYCEDVDLCRRLHRAGWKVMYLPTTSVVHAIGQSSNQAQARMIVERHRAMLLFFCKHHTRGARALLLPVAVGGIVVRGIGALVRLFVNRVIERLRSR